MARIAGVDLPREKRIEVALQYIYGIGKTTAKAICERANVKVETRTKDLTDDEVKRSATPSSRTSRSRATSAARCR